MTKENEGEISTEMVESKRLRYLNELKRIENYRETKTSIHHLNHSIALFSTTTMITTGMYFYDLFFKGNSHLNGLFLDCACFLLAIGFSVARYLKNQKMKLNNADLCSLSGEELYQREGDCRFLFQCVCTIEADLLKDEKETKEKPIQSFHSMNLKETKQDQEDLLNRYFEELPRYQLLMDDTVLPVSFKKIGQKKI